DLAVLARTATKEPRRRLPATADLILRESDERVPRLRRVAAARVQLGEGRGDIRVADSLGDQPTLLLDLLEVLQSEVVHLARLQRQRGPREDLGLVHGLTTGERR